MAKKMSETNVVEMPTTVNFSVVEKRSEKPTVGVLEIVKSVTKQKQSVLNLDSGKDEEIIVQQCNFLVPEFNADLHISLEDYNNAKIAAAQSLVQPAAKQADALLKFAANEVYANSKRDALAAGNFMTQELKTQLVKMLRMRPAFADDSAKEIFERWEAGFAKQNPNAIKYLNDARTILNAGTPEDEGF